MNLLRSVSLLALASCALPSSAGLFSFDAVSVGAAVPFKLNSGDNDGYFSSSVPFTVTDVWAGTTTLKGHVLASSGAGSLTIVFPRLVDGLDFRFATSVGASVTLNFYQGGVGTYPFVATGIATGGGFSEGRIALGTSFAFDRLVISANGPLAIDDLIARNQHLAAPGPAAALSFAFMALGRRKRRTA